LQILLTFSAAVVGIVTRAEENPLADLIRTFRPDALDIARAAADAQ
jgi:hypothetical protein